MMTRKEKRAHYEKHKPKKNKKLPHEESILTPAARAIWDQCRKDYELFRQDALVPTANIHWTPYRTIYNAYKLYCRALGIPVCISDQKLGILLKENFMFQRKEVHRFGCVIRKDLFVKEEDEITITEV